MLKNITNLFNSNQYTETFGINPKSVGHYKRGYWIIKQTNKQEEALKIKPGDLCVRTKDGGDAPVWKTANKYDNYLGSITNPDRDGECYRHYYFARR